MKISGLKTIRPVLFLTLIILFFDSCSCYMKTDLGDESIDVSITRKKDAAEKTGIILSFNKVSSVLDIPAELQGMKVIKIVFADATNMSSLKNITIPDSVTEIDTFEKASSLVAVNLPDNLAYMPSFKECSKLTEIAIPAGVVEIPESCFEGCESLATIYKKGSSTDTLEGIKAIGKRAFYNCKALSAIALETTKITSLEELTFYGCSKLDTITLPDSVQKIDDQAFESCIKLRTVIGFKNIKQIGKKVFYSCTSLNSIELNPEINKDEKQNENGETKITIKIPDNLFNGCEKLQSIIIPDRVTALGTSIFANCKALNELTIPEGIETISSNLCNGCLTLKSLSLPSTITKIDSSAIKDCNGLTKIICKAENPPLIDESNSLAVENLKNDLIIYVPDNRVDAYKDKAAWGEVFKFSDDTVEENPSEAEPSETSENTQKKARILIKGLNEII